MNLSHIIRSPLKLLLLHWFPGQGSLYTNSSKRVSQVPMAPRGSPRPLNVCPTGFQSQTFLESHLCGAGPKHGDAPCGVKTPHSLGGISGSMRSLLVCVAVPRWGFRWDCVCTSPTHVHVVLLFLAVEGAVRLVFSYFSAAVMLSVAADLVCPWKEVSWGFSYTPIMTISHHTVVLHLII